MFINKQISEYQIIDFVIPGDQNIDIKEQKKTDKYQNLKIGLQKAWNVKVAIIPVVIGPLRTLLKKIYH